MSDIPHSGILAYKPCIRAHVFDLLRGATRDTYGTEHRISIALLLFTSRSTTKHYGQPSATDRDDVTEGLAMTHISSTGRAQETMTLASQRPFRRHVS